MARPRSNPPGTPFGAWLVSWFDAHPDVTLEAFGDDVGVTKGAVSLWISSQRRVAVKAPTLARVAKRTGEPLANLEVLVYGEANRDMALPSDPRSVVEPKTSLVMTPAGLPPEVLDQIEERIRLAFRAELAAAIERIREEQQRG